MVMVHYMVHCTSLVVKTLTKLKFVSKIESLMESMYNYLSIFLGALEVRKLIEILHTKGNKILKNIKAHKIFVLLPSKRILALVQTIGCEKGY